MLKELHRPGTNYLRRAEAYYRKYMKHIDFYDDMFHYCENGYIVCSPHLMFMGKPVPKGAKENEIMASYIKFDIDKCDTLYVNLFIGDLKLGLNALPDLYEYVCFQRNGAGPLRYFNVKRLRRKV